LCTRSPNSRNELIEKDIRQKPGTVAGLFLFGVVVVHTPCNGCSSLEHFLPALRPGIPYFHGMLDAEHICGMQDSGHTMPSLSVLLSRSHDGVSARAQF
jgi:hypothetical protein